MNDLRFTGGTTHMKRGLLFLMISLLTLLSSASAEKNISQTGWTTAVPAQYTVASDHLGTVEQIVYDTKDYAGDGSAIQKVAYVYLPYGYRDVLLLYYYQDLNQEEVAQVLNTSPSTVSKRLKHARDKLRTLLERGREL